MPRKSTYTWDRAAAENYISKLGCHRFANPTDAIKRRNPQTYRRLLLCVIECNRSRTDQAGKWETVAAKDALKKLGLKPA